jgi:hypothetical protein
LKKADLKQMAFYPWLTIEKPLSVGKYELTPFVRGQEPFGKETEEQKIVDRILRSYVHAPDGPISEATILKIDGNAFNVQLAKEEKEDLFRFNELLAFSAMSQRTYFDSSGYINRDSFILCLQGFEHGRIGTSVMTRRKDWNTTTFLVDGGRFSLPLHVPSNYKPRFDLELLIALLSVFEDERGCKTPWSNYYNCIYSYNLSNTDNDQISDNLEMVLMVGALEMLLGIQNGSEKSLLKVFMSVFKPDRYLNVFSCPRLPSGDSVASEWLSDAFRLRGQFAHGRAFSPYQSKRKKHEHLLLGAFLLPLLLKQCLFADGKYSFTDEDRQKMNSFEKMCCEDLFAKSTNPEDRFDWPMHRILNDAKWELLTLKIKNELDGVLQSKSDGSEKS